MAFLLKNTEDSIMKMETLEFGKYFNMTDKKSLDDINNFISLLCKASCKFIFSHG